MKILQAIVTSTEKHLGGSQGYGLVYCSERLPSSVKDAATKLGYPDDAAGQPVYTTKAIDVESHRWLLMNRTVPDADFTGRSSYVSHTIAVPLDELRQFLQSGQCGVASVFEFMRDFPWKSSWKEEVKLIQASDDLDASDVECFWSKRCDVSNPLDPAGLLAFDYPQEGRPIPKELAWNFGDASPDNMLEIFHQAWICLDPWRGLCKHGTILGAPPFALLDSWECYFTTNLRHERSDAYRWVSLSKDTPTIPSLSTICPSDWKAMSSDAVKEKMSSEVGNNLVDCCIEGPEIWAQLRLKKKLEDLKQEFEQKLQKNSSENYRNAFEVIQDFKKSVGEIISAVKTYEESEWWYFDQQESLDHTRKHIKKYENQAKHESRYLIEDYKTNAAGIIQILSKRNEEIILDDIDDPQCFSDLFDELETLAKQYVTACKIVRICEFADQYEREKKDQSEKNLAIQVERDDLKNKSHGLEQENALLNEKLRITEVNRSLLDKELKNKKTIDLTPVSITIISGAMVVVLVTLALLWKSGSESEKKLNEANHAKTILNKSIDIRDLEIRSLKGENDRLEAEFRKLNESKEKTDQEKKNDDKINGVQSSTPKTTAENKTDTKPPAPTTATTPQVNQQGSNAPAKASASSGDKGASTKDLKDAPAKQKGPDNPATTTPPKK
jgi:hypothetical protein